MSKSLIGAPFVCTYQGDMLAGVDEVGRGPLAGPVVTAAVILDPARPISGLMDSKVLTGERREELALIIKEQAVAWSLGRCEVHEIDQYNIYQATLIAMERAVAGLKPIPEYILVDGNRCPKWRWASEPVIKGDSRVEAISAASILAKVARDAEMVELDGRFPGYGFASHKGYATPMHMESLSRLGASPIHRRSFRPVREALEAMGMIESDEDVVPTDLFDV